MSGPETTPNPDESAPKEDALRCPICDAPVAPDHPTAPFCSGRCKLVDLGKWLSGEYVVSRDLTEKDLDEPE